MLASCLEFLLESLLSRSQTLQRLWVGDKLSEQSPGGLGRGVEGGGGLATQQVHVLEEVVGQAAALEWDE